MTLRECIPRRKCLYGLADRVNNFFRLVEYITVLKPKGIYVVIPMQIISAYVILCVTYGGVMIMTI